MEIERIISFGFSKNISRNSRPQYIKFIEAATKTKISLWHPFAHNFPRLSVSCNETLAGYIDLLDFSAENISRFIPAAVAQDLVEQFERDGEGLATVQGIIEQWPWRVGAEELLEIGLIKEYSGSIVLRTARARCYIPVYNWEAQTAHFPSSLLEVANRMKEEFIEKEKNININILMS